MGINDRELEMGVLYTPPSHINGGGRKMPPPKGAVHSGGGGVVYGDGSWDLTVFVTDLQVGKLSILLDHSKSPFILSSLISWKERKNIDWHLILYSLMFQSFIRFPKRQGLF